MTAPDDALARALARLCLDGGGTYRAHDRVFYFYLRRNLPPGHPAAALDDETLSRACAAVRNHLGDVYRVQFLRSRDSHRRGAPTSTVRLIRNPRPVSR